MAQKTTTKNVNVKTVTGKKASAKKKTSKTKTIFEIVMGILLIAGFCGGYFTVKQITKNDTFALQGEKFVELNVGDEYIESGVKIISFGRDISSKAIIDDSNVNTSEEGIYYVKYTVNDLRYGKVVRYRTVVVSEVDNG